MHIVIQEKGDKTNVFFGLLVFHSTYICRLMASYIPGTVLEASDTKIKHVRTPKELER